MEYEDTSNLEQGQKKPVLRRGKVVVTKVTEKELSQIKDTANQCGMTRSDFIRLGHSATNHGKGFPTGNWTVCVSLQPAARTW